jgi:hypothetical protein
MKKNIVYATAILLAFAFSPSLNADTTYTAAGNCNPLVPGYFADPTIQKFGDTYYLYATTDGIKLASGEPQVWISKDFVNWYNYEMDVPLPKGLTNCWAPDVVRGNDGRYYYFQGNCEANCNIYGYVSDSAMGPWTRINDGKAVIPAGTGANGLPALDAQYLWDNDTTLYSFFGTWCTSFGGLGWASIDPHDMITIKNEGLIPVKQLPMVFEGAYPMKKNNKYIMMYSSGDCQLSTYAVRYGYADHPTGPYTAGANSPILVTNKDATIDGPGHHSVLKDGENYYIVYHRHNNPHSTGGEFRQVCADSLVFLNDSTIRKVVPSHQGVGYLGINQVPYPNLAYQANVTATSWYHLISPASQFSGATDFEYSPGLAVDNNNGTLWKAGNGLLPQSLIIDLGDVKTIQRVMTEFEYPTLYYQYKIETSTDSISWLTYADKTSNRRSGCPMIDDNNTDARFIKITVTATEKSGMYAAIWNVKVYESTFEIPANQGEESSDGPGTLITNSLLVDLNIDTETFNAIADSIPNTGTLGGIFTKVNQPVISWIDSIKSVFFNGKCYFRLRTVPVTLDWNSGYTAAVWVYNPTVGNGECLMLWNSRLNLLLESYSALMYGTGPYGAMAHGNGYADLGYKAVPSKAQWHHIAVTFDGMLEKVYVDGELNTTWPVNLFVTPDYVKIGASGGSGENLSGFIARAQLFDSVFTAEGVVELMNSTRPAKVAGPVTGITSVKNDNPYNVFYDSSERKIRIIRKDNNELLQSARLVSMDGKILQNYLLGKVSTAEMSLDEKGAYIVVLETEQNVFSTKIMAY